MTRMIDNMKKKMYHINVWAFIEYLFQEQEFRFIVHSFIYPYINSFFKSANEKGNVA